MLENLDGTVTAPEGTVTLEDSAVAITPAENKDSKLDSIINAAIEKVEGPEGSPKTEIKADDTGRARGPDGKFVSTKPAEAQPSTEPAKADAKTAEQPDKVVDAKPAEQPLEPHPRWSDADKALFAKLDREAQQWALNREKDAEGIVTRKTQELAEQRKAHEPLLAEIQKESQYLQSLGIRPEQAWRDMMATERTLRLGTPQEKIGALAHLAQFYGIPLPTNGGDVAAMPAIDPQIQNMAQKIAALERQLEERERNAQLNERQRAEYEFNALAQTKDENGHIKFPHFERVRTDMIRLVANGQAETWDQAYTKAIRLDDELYKQVVEEERQKALQAAEKARQDALEKAEKAKPIVASSSLLNGKSQLKGLDAHIQAALDRAGIQ